MSDEMSTSQSGSSRPVLEPLEKRTRNKPGGEIALVKDDVDLSPYPTLAAYTDKLVTPNRRIVGREREQDQVMAALSRPELSNVILLAPAGSGKALVDECPIPTPTDDGYTPIGELEVGDQVYDENGEIVYVDGVFPQGVCDVYTVSLADGTVIECNGEHLWTVYDDSVEGSDPAVVTTTTQDLYDRGLFYGDRLHRWSLPKSGSVDRRGYTWSIDYYALGVLAAHGTCTSAGIGLYGEYSEYNPEIIEIIEESLGTDTYFQQDDPVFWSWSEMDKATARNYGILDTVDFSDSTTYGLGSRAQRSMMVEGILDSSWVGTLDEDGDIDDDAVELTLFRVLKDRASAVYEILRSTGSRPHRHSEDEEYAYFYLDPVLDALTIVDIKKTSERKSMTCIHVTGESHLFLAGKEHIVTHNTALVQSIMLKDTKRLYLEVDLARMIANLTNPSEMAARIKRLFDEAEQFSKEEGFDLVLFIDEFHQVVQLSAAAVEALKPVLAASGTRGILVIAATTYDEYNQYIAPNQPLVERLQVINLTPSDKQTTISILRGMAERYEVANQFYDDDLFEMIYDLTNRYIPRSAQPRKSILILDSMVGWHRYTGRKMDKQLIADVLSESANVNIIHRIDATAIRDELDSAVLSQKFATKVLSKRLQICVADLHDKTKPQASFLFTGSTGVGKAIVSQDIIPAYDDNGRGCYKKAKNVKVGDFLCDREGKPTEVLGVFPQGVRDVYRVHCGDGRFMDVSDNHLWTVYDNSDPDRAPDVLSTQDLVDRDIMADGDRGEVYYRYSIDLNGPVQWDWRDYDVDPYVVGALLGHGVVYDSDYGGYDISDMAPDIRAKVCRLLDISDDSTIVRIPASYTTKVEVKYQCGSIQQRRDFIDGFCDTRGEWRYDESGELDSLVLRDEAYDVLAAVQQIFYSLGIITELKTVEVDGVYEYELVFTAAVRSAMHPEGYSDRVNIIRIDKTPRREEMVCFYVDNEEHLFQGARHMVTHNTEMTKQLSKLLFGDDQRRLIRFDMAEFSQPTSLATFKSELGQQVRNLGHVIILFDEIEKACPEVVRLLLAVLDDGRLTDDHGRQVSFLNTYIIMTTNAGSEIYETIAQYAVDDEGSGRQMDEFMKNIERSIRETAGAGFPPELLGRIDAIVPFQPLSRETQRSIIINKLKKLRIELKKKHNVSMSIDKKVVNYLVDDKIDTDSNAGGARAAVRRLTDDVVSEVAAYINMYPDHKKIGVTVQGEMINESKTRLKSEARIVVMRME